MRRIRRKNQASERNRIAVIRIQLPVAEADRLEQAFRHETDPKYRDRLQIVRLANRGRPHQDIAQDLATTTRSVQRWLNAFCERGLEGLRPRKAKGAAAKIPDALADEIRGWVIEGPVQQGLDRANWTHEELADHLFKTRGIKTSRSAMQRFCRKIDIRVYRPTYRFLRGKPEKQAQARQDIAELKEQAQAGELVLLSQDEARFPMVPTATATLGVKGHRPVVGTWDCKDLLYAFCVVNLVSAAIHSNTLESPKDAKKKTGKSKTRRLQEAFAQHLRHIGRIYPRDKHKQVVLLIDNAPWHAGQPVKEALADNPHLVFKRLPSYSPQLNPIERFWKMLRRRATHNRLFDSLADLKGSIRNSLCYFQTMRARVKTLLNARKKRTVNRTAS
jgi:transposase